MKNKMIAVISAFLLLALSLWNLLAAKNDYSESERRVLARFPEISIEAVLSDDFADEFEAYVVDHFPKRDLWRSIKAYTKTKVLGQKDNNGLFQADGHISKIEYPMNLPMLDHALQVFAKVKDQYLNESNKIYLAVVPDKNRYLAEKTGYLSLDYEEFSSYLAEGMDYAQYIEIADLLESDDYYYTDSHWRQEKIVDVAERLLEEMGMESEEKTNGESQYHMVTFETPFYGVYVGQSALKCEPDKIVYLTNDTIANLQVEGADAVYDMKLAAGRDAYEMFLSGNQAIVSINNPLKNNGKRLVVFRDSFGSSIAPLLSEAYSEIVLVDLRYISSEMLVQFVDFEDADVLFLYSTLLLNNSMAIK